MKKQKMNIELKKFSMEMVNDDQTVILIGKRNTGKSFLIRDLFYHHQDIPAGICISPTEKANRFFGDFIPPIFIHDEYDPAIIEGLISRQKKLVRKKRKDSKYNDTDIRVFCIMDDCLYDESWQKDKCIREIFMNGRHYKILYLLTSQYPLGIKPLMRSNIDWVFILRENIVSNRKRIYDNYAGMFPTFEIFNQTMDACTENYECLVIHNASKSNKIEDQVFWYKADDHDEFRVGKEKIWAMCEEVEDSSDDDINLDDPSRLRNTKTDVSIHKNK